MPQAHLGLELGMSKVESNVAFPCGVPILPDICFEIEVAVR